MTTLLIIISCLFWAPLLYYAILTVAGMTFRSGHRTSKPLTKYPSVAILIPAHNEGIVLSSTLDSMVKLLYPGELQILMLDDSSTDETFDIAEQFAQQYAHVSHVLVPPGTPKGKARVLNYGLRHVETDYVAVYDADNQPEPDALRLLVESAETTARAVGAVGYVKTLNISKNWLTRMIGLEFSAFQLLMQAGRWQLFQLGSLTGTNMLVRRTDLLRVGGWDPYALAEDAELTLALTHMGGKLPVVPTSRSWEQEPENLRVWIRQRTRWMQGNLYLIQKMFSRRHYRHGKVLLHTGQLLGVYVLFVSLLLISDVWFVLGLFGMSHTSFSMPLMLLWFESWWLYVIQLLCAEVTDELVSPLNVLMGALMYVTYAQLWIVLIFRALYFQVKLSRQKLEPVWDKTIRF